MRVYKVQLEHYNGPCCYKEIEPVLCEIKNLLLEDSDCVITVEVTQMEEDVYNNLPEFAGY